MTRLLSGSLILAASVGLLATAQAGPLSGTIDLSTVGDTTPGVRFQGIADGDRAGWCVSSAGDVNGDVLDDLLITGDWAGPSDDPDAGETYLVYGQRDPSALSGTISLSTVGDTTPGVCFRGFGYRSWRHSGLRASSAGDTNGDGLDDLLIVTQWATLGDKPYAGEVYLVYGQRGPEALSGTISLASVGDSTPGARFQGSSEYHLLGSSIAAAGDINGDGVGDLLIAARDADPRGKKNAGETYLVYGQRAPTPLSGTIDISTVGDTTPGVRFEGIDALDASGGSVSSGGDVNADGVDDLLISARLASAHGAFEAGEAYLVYGQPGAAALSGTIVLSTVGGTTAGAKFEGIHASDNTGYPVSAAGDINADGADDLLIGSRFGEESFLIYGQPGPAALSGTIRLSTVGNTTPGVQFKETYTSFALSAAGDINGDGVDDLLMGAPGADHSCERAAGKAYLVYGQRGAAALSGTIDLPTIGDTTLGATFRGIRSYDNAGHSVSAAGDINGDGVDDLLIGAPGADPGGRSAAGEAYLIYGQPVPEPSTFLLTVPALLALLACARRRFRRT